MSGRRRALLILAVAAVALLAVALLLVRHYAQPEQVARLARQFAHEQLGLELDFAGEPRFAFWPRLRLELDQAQLAAAGASPLLSAKHVQLVLPWRSLRAEVLRVDQLELDTPLLDADALTSWLAGGSATTLPAAQFAVHIKDGAVQRDGVRIAEGVMLDGDFDLLAWDAWWRGLPAAVRVEQLLPPGAMKLSIARAQLGEVRAEGIVLESDAP
jgi:AsmA protein